MKLVLVVEDEYGSAQALGLLLECEGYAVGIAANGRIALERMAHARPDLIVSDYMMPVMNGAQLGHVVRARAEWASIPIVLTSAADETRVRGEFAGYDAFLRKPFDAGQLVSLVTRLLADPGATPARGPAGLDGVDPSRDELRPPPEPPIER
ncbi:MAG TPA: response regulator [Burkholderiaceae bacterium]|nr:response regulator [Burkholderiaceae bacterium]